jgi:hypothetical protein
MSQVVRLIPRRRTPAAPALLGGLALVALATAIGFATSASAVTNTCGATGVPSGTTTLTCTYSAVGSDTFTVPAGVTQVDILAVGGKGGNYFIAGDAAHPPPAGDITGRPGGAGGQAAGSFTVTPGQTLQVDVAGRGVNGTAASRSGGMMNGPSGGQGALGGFGGSNGGVLGGGGDAGGANGGTAFNGGNGSGGGGSSDVRGGVDCSALTCGLATRLIVGAGGGGGGGGGGQGNALGGAGGAGGGATGADGSTTVDGGNAGRSGTGAAAGAGGTGGLNACLHTAGVEPNDPRCGGDGGNGASGAGGTGGAGNLPCNGVHIPPCQDPNATTSGGGAGGGAGGGFFGGGGGSGGGGTFGGGGGGGGGAGGGGSFLAGSALSGTLTSGVNNDTINAGNGLVTISFTAPAPSQPPSATTGASSAITASGASLAGTVNPNGSATNYVFEYGTSLSFGSISSVSSAGAGSADTPVTATLSGLAGDTTYYYRLVATNAQGTSVGSVAAFNTSGAPSAPVVVTEAPVSVANDSAVLAATVNPKRQQTSFTIEYGTTSSFGAITPVVALDNANAPEAVTATAPGLASNTTYLYRVVASNATGTSVGIVRSFTTGPGSAPFVTTGAASNISGTAATLAATVDPRGHSTAFAFEYGTTNSFGLLSAVDDAGAGSGPQAVSLPLTGLAPNTTYRYRVVATNSLGTTAGTVGSFTTTGPAA